MTASIRWRDILDHLLPPWLRYRPSSGRTSGYRFAWGMVAPIDALWEILVEGLQAPWPGKGTPTALTDIGRSRGIIRGQNESNESYAARLRAWLDTWRDAGSQERVARAIHEYIYPHPRVRYVNRHGQWTTVNEDGSVEVHEGVPFDWDSVTHPERQLTADEPEWADAWIIVYPTTWARPATLLNPADTETFADDEPLGLGHDVTATERDEIVGLVNQWKSDHTFIRAILWSYDATLFDPDVPSSLPDGTWGTWGLDVGGTYGPSGRDIVNVRYWEPRS